MAGKPVNNSLVYYSKKVHLMRNLWTRLEILENVTSDQQFLKWCLCVSINIQNKLFRNI